MVDAIEQVASTMRITLSSSQLRRHLRELFGTRPEPWRELAVDDKVTTTVTNADGIVQVEEPAPAEDVVAPQASARKTLPWFAADVEGAKVPLLATLRMQGPIVPPAPVRVESVPSPAITAPTMDVRRGGRSADPDSAPSASSSLSAHSAHSSVTVPAGKRSSTAVIAILLGIVATAAAVIAIVVASSTTDRAATVMPTTPALRLRRHRSRSPNRSSRHPRTSRRGSPNRPARERARRPGAPRTA
jgi:hypothetical protein